MSQVKAPSQISPTPVLKPVKTQSAAPPKPPQVPPTVPQTSQPQVEKPALNSLPAKGQAETLVPFVSEDTQAIVEKETQKTLIEETAKLGATKGVKKLNQTLLSSSSRLSQAAALRTSRALSASVPVAGATISAISAKGDFERAQAEDKAGNEWAARAFGASSALNGFDASLGVLSAGSALTGFGLPVAATLEVVGWASTGMGLLLGIGGEYLSQKDL